MATAQRTIEADQRVYENRYEEAPGEGWVLFAGIVMAMAGTLNFIYGIAAIANSNFYVANAHFVVSNLNTWGWVVLFVGVLQFCVAVGVWVKAQWARWTGVVLAGLSAILALIFIPAYPFLALSIFALDLLVIYGLVSYGGRTQGA